jgi:hypothetical protein
MALFARTKGDENVTAYVFIPDTSSLVGEGLTGLAFDTANLTCYYCRPGAAAVEIELVTQTVTGDHTDGGFCAVNPTYAPGAYRVDLPDAACATGADFVMLFLQGALHMPDRPLLIQLDDPSTLTPAAIVQTLAELLLTTHEGTAPAGSVLELWALQSGQFKVTSTDNGNGTSTVTLYKSDGTTVWDTFTANTAANPTEWVGFPGV